MQFFRLLRGGAQPLAGESDQDVPEAVEGASPGVAALFDGMIPDGSLRILDLGPGVAGNFRLFSEFARQMSFVGLLGNATDAEVSAAFGRIPVRPDPPFDLVFAWDMLDRIPPERRPELIDLLARASAPQARLHVMVRAAGPSSGHPLRFSLLDVNRVRYEVTGPPSDEQAPIPPSEVERLLDPAFRVVQAFSLRVGLREYVAIRR